MEPIQSASVQKDCLEHLYNHKQICSSLVHEGPNMAKVLFSRKVKYLTENHDVFPSNESAIIMLTSLNRSMYDYLDLLLNLSFTECCFQNRVHIFSVKDAQTLAHAGGKIIDAYAACLKNSRANCPLIECVCGYISDHLDSDLSLEQVSAEVFISKSHLCSLFKSFAGITFGEYVRRQRIQHARMLLLAGQLSIDDIASACGIHSSTYFATVFKQETGMTPSAFRANFSKHD